MRTTNGTPTATASVDGWLAAGFGAYQFVHVLVNGRYMFSDRAEAFPAPDGGWDAQTVAWAGGMAIVDFVIAVVSLVFVVGFLARRAWSVPVGLVATAVFTAASLMFTISVIEIGALSASPGFYAFIILAGFPGYVLFVRLLMRAVRTSTATGA